MGPLQGIRILEMGGVGPGPFCGMMLADMGAEVIRIERASQYRISQHTTDVLSRGKKSISLDLKKPQGIDAVLRMIPSVDGLFEGFRPGVMEKLGLGPEVCLERNPRLVYGRMTGWGQEGPLSREAGHDINYIALTGALHCMGRAGERPVPPLNLVGDFGGGGMLLAFGMVCALLERERLGRGQVVDSAIIDGAAALMAMIHGFRAAGRWSLEREDNILDGAAPFYDTYETRDGKYVALGSVEPAFYQTLLRLLGLEQVDPGAQYDKQGWAELKKAVAARIRQKTRDEWCEIFQGQSACFAPVLHMDEARLHPHNTARKTFLEINGVVQGAPAPRFSRTTPPEPAPPPEPGCHTQEILLAFGFSEPEIIAMRAQNVF
ncbi:MAG: CoA transferase [Desulfarculus sp.]|nr:CoA transferase [Pseudomonadota bacterium]MBU4600156.1 CoA transferase [Pseudomonadota bacterium]MBV1715599.1 CoA transferase [Desulfarculus sp.]MBV1738869.1 CoA transferase [Desulfarculus sp.]